jgi:ornithine carbamoyltransferase
MPSSVRTKDFVSVLDFEPAELESCLSLAARVKRERALGKKAPTANALGGAHVALLFEKPSLRTISTFEIAIRELGGDVITPYPVAALSEREPAVDVARNLER